MPNSISKHLQQQSSLYVLNALSKPERVAFEEKLQLSEELQQLVGELKATLETTRAIPSMRPREEYLQGQRNLLRGKIDILENEKSNRPVLVSVQLWFERFTDRFLGVRQPVWAVALYIAVAFLAGRLMFNTGDDGIRRITVPPKKDIRQMVESGSLSNVDIDINNDDQIKLAVQTKNDLDISGGLEDETIRQILYYLLLNDQNPGKRLKAMKILGEGDPMVDAKSVLISSLLSDPNPGVRLRAVELLNFYEPDKLLIDASIKILMEDENEAVRMGALTILGKSRSERIIPALQVVSRMDANEFIRDQARRILEEFNGITSSERVEVLQ